MSEADNRLSVESDAVEQHFSSHPKISIVSTEGTPPEKYVVEFQVGGLARLENGDIVQSDQHRVEISLSFGFPHFPPNCKPLTEIFHPDIDPSAIKIADFWDKTKTLVDLINHIARMIAWQVYSDENVFNPAAMDWLTDHGSEIPADQYDFLGDAGSASSVEEDNASSDVPLDLDESNLPEIQFGTVELGAEELNEDDAAIQSATEADVPEIKVQSAAFSNPEPADESAVSEDEFPEIEFQSTAFAQSAPPDSSPAADDDFPEIEFQSEALGDSSSSSGSSQDDETPEIEFQSSALDDVSEGSMRLDLGDISVDEIELDVPADDPASKSMKLDLDLSSPDDESAGEQSDIVIENIAVDETLNGLSHESFGDDEIDLDLNEVDVDFDIFSGMLDQRKYYAARKKFVTLPVEQQSADVKSLHITVEERIEAVEDVHKTALDFESQGLIEKAAGKLEEVMEAVADFPGLEADMKRVRNAWMLLGQGNEPASSQEPALTLESTEADELSSLGETELPTMSSDNAFQAAPPPAAAQSETLASPSAPRSVAKKKKSPPKVKEPKGPGFFAQKQNRPIIIAGGVLMVAILLSLWGGYEWRSYAKADTLWGEMNSLLEAGNFDKAKADCARIKKIVGSIKLFKNGDKKELLAKVDDLLGSEHFREGIEGKILHQGRYISKRAHRAYEQIDAFIAKGEKQGAAADWQNALATYEKAQKIAKENKDRLDPKVLAQVDLLVSQTRFAQLVSTGKTHFIASQWSQAISVFEKAMLLAKKKDVADPSTSYDVHRYLQRARFSMLVNEGDALLKEKKWAAAVDKFTAAQKISTEKNIIETSKAKYVLVKQSQTLLLRSMVDGDAFRDKRKWAKAVHEYQVAADVVKESIPLPGKSQVETEKIVYGSLLGVLVKMETNIAAGYIEQQKYSKARAAYQRIVAAINSSSFASQPDMVAILEKTKKQIRETELASVIDDKKAYLMDHYKDIFTENFVGVRATSLTQPQIDFLESKDDILIFRMRCREKQEVKFFTLELVYQYDMIVEQWGFAKN